MANITNVAMTNYQTRTRSIPSKPGLPGQPCKDSKVLTMEDLSPALQDQEVTCKKPPSYV